MLPRVLAVSIMLTEVTAPVSASSYRGTQGHWGQAAIDKWNGYGVVHGYAGAFRPGAPVTRAEFAVMMDSQLYRAAATEFPKHRHSNQYADERIDNDGGEQDGHIKEFSPVFFSVFCLFLQVVEVK
ncbi:hypothetical protein J6TS7_53750 [Paenibacillus dendritiformis]|nr:hypothetical protein J6TS7_53750 [Paenibacillus dendritiformis]